ncbi:MAG: class I SAM-dependent methyltransferase [Kiritimatiellae bacterium]|nr:class I SAM-dependent methyltransferase [Kiritimatiellia bacterium]
MSGGREKIAVAAQRAYWDALSPEYARITRIDVRDFHWGPQIPGEKTLRLLPPRPRAGATALELGCGGAQNSVWLSRRGWRCAAADASPEQIARARAIAAKSRVSVEFAVAPLENFAAAFPRRKFDLVHSSHALEFVDDPGPVVKAMAGAAKRGGHVAVSTVHPLFNGEWIEGEFEDENGRDAGDAGAGLFLTDYFSPPDDVRDDACGHVVSRAWPVSAWFDWFSDAGLEVVRLAEPPAAKTAPYTSDDWADHGGQLDRIPSTLAIVGRRR